jgi:hypothetical protein
MMLDSSKDFRNDMKVIDWRRLLCEVNHQKL